jgi:AcrR family transcriptional regulator
MPAVGRPRSALSRRNILVAALELARTHGYAELTIEQIAGKAGVGKQTIYRWWPSKAAVVLEALRENARVEVESPDTGALLSDLEGLLKNTFELTRRRPGIDSVLRAMMAEAQHDPEFATRFRSELIDPRREVLYTLFRRARERGEIRTLHEIDLWVDVAFGVLWYRMLAEVGPLNRALAMSLARLLAQAAGARIPSTW